MRIRIQNTALKPVKFVSPMCRGERGLATPTLVPREDEEESAYNEHFKNEQEKVRTAHAH